jgi:membrane-associated phospholipid phosphatase
LTALVATGATASADAAIRDTMRPHDVWGTSQAWADVVVEGLRSDVMVALVITVTAVFSLVRRNWIPLAHGALLVLTSSAVVAAAKLSLSRTDPHHDPSSIGSFPSGHVMFVLVGLGGLLIVSGLRTSWVHWAVVAAATVAMGVALLIQGAHWGSDVLGGALLGLLVLGAADHVVQRGRRQGHSSPRSSVYSAHDRSAA